jgi:hypothetical protein
MRRFSVFLLALTTLSVPAVTSVAQNAYVSGANGAEYSQPAAPIERAAPQNQNAPQSYSQPRAQMPNIATLRPVNGVVVRADHPDALHTLASDTTRIELKLDHGRANVSVHDPAPDMLVLVDLPGGQTQLLKNGFYTFNAETNTVRVLSGEADAFVANSNKPIKVKEDNQLVFAADRTHESYSDPYYARQDVLPGNAYAAQSEPGYAAPPPSYGYAYGPYGDGFAPYYGGWGYPYGYGWGYPYYGWGYPIGIGFGWGWGGGFYRGGFYRGGFGYRGGFRR